MDTKIRELIDSLDLTQETKKWNKTSKSEQNKNEEERNVGEWSKYLDYLMDIYNKKQLHGSVDNLLKFVGQRPEQNETTRLKTITIHYQPPAEDIIEGNKPI